MPNTINTPLNQQIQGAIANQSNIGETIKNMYSQLPEQTAQARQNIFGGDTVLSSLQTGFSDKVKELYNYDQAKNNAFSAPATTQGGVAMNINPMIGERANQAEFKNAVSAKEDAWQLYETRKNLLGDALDKAVKLLEGNIKMKESERAAAKDTVDSLQALYNEENDRAYKSGMLSLEEKKLKDALGTKGASVAGMSPEEMQAVNFDEMSDAEIVAAAKGIYGPTIKLGTQSQAPAYARSLMEEYKKNGYDINVLSSMMDNPTAASFRDSVQLAKDAKEALGSLTSKNIYQSIGDVTTGPFASAIGSITGQTTDDPKVKVRNLIDQMRAGKIKEFYGGAFTTTEESNATWLPKSTKQESTNIVSLERLVKTAENKMRAALELQGIRGPMQDALVTKLMGSGTTTQGRIPLSDPSLQD